MSVAKAIPAYRRIAGALTRRIEAGKLREGDVVPSERELAAEFGVSLMTARHALEELTAEGKLSRRPRVGTFVAPARIHFNRLTSFTEEMASRGSVARSRILSAGVTAGDDEICPRLSLAAGAQVVCVERLRLSEEEPYAMESCWLAAGQFAGILEEDLETKSLFSILAEEYGVTIMHADEEIDAIAADGRTAALLGVKAGAPVLRIRQVLFGKAGAVAFTSALYRSDRHSFHARRFRQGI